MKSMKDKGRRNSQTLFYVLVPVYKAQNFLSCCIESVRAQTYRQYKLVLVDDGSPDMSGEICDAYASKDSNIVVIHQHNQGALAARQTALKWALQDYRASSEERPSYIVYLDSDDTLKPYALNEIQASIQTHQCDMVIYGYDKVKDNRLFEEYDAANGFEGIVENKRLLYKMVFCDSAYNSLCRKAISLSLVNCKDLSRFYGVEYGEDLLESIDYLKNSKRVFFLNKSLYNYTMNMDSVTHSFEKNAFRVHYPVREYAYEFLIKEDVFSETDWIEYQTYCIRLLCSLISRNMSIKVDRTRKRLFLTKLRETTYYLECILNKKYDVKKLGIKNALVFAIFSRAFDTMIIRGYEVHSLLMSIKKRMKHG